MMAVLVDNNLSGPVGVAPTTTRLSGTATTGTVTPHDTTEAAYTDMVTVQGLTTLEIPTGHHRSDGTTGEGTATARLAAGLSVPPWTARFYAKIPGMRAAGNGANEVRWLCRVGDYGLTVAEDAGGTMLMHLESIGLAQERSSYDTADGAWPVLDQLLRFEVTYDGTDLVVGVFAGHSTSAEVTLTWAGYSLNATSVVVTGYRYRDGVLLQPGMNDANLSGTPIEDRQNQLLVWDPNILPNWGADGDYGDETTSAVEDFQTAFGFSLIDGEIGPETGAAMDLMVQQEEGTATPPPVRVSHLAVTDTTSVGPATAPSGTAESTVEVGVTAGHVDPPATAGSFLGDCVPMFVGA